MLPGACRGMDCYYYRCALGYKRQEEKEKHHVRTFKIFEY